MITATGVFYNGISSVAQEISVCLDTQKSVLIFKINDETHIWELASILFEQKGVQLHLQHGDNPIQNIKISDSDFVAQITLFREKKGLVSAYQKLMRLGLKFHFAFAFFLFGIIGLSYVYVLPWLAEKTVILIPKEYDDTLGDAFFKQNTLLGTVDSAKTKALNQFAKELKLNNTKKLKFTVIDSDIMNAFALPDGSIVVYTGIIDSMKGYDELAGLIGHEVAHVNNRHSMKMLCRNLSGYLFVSTILGDVNGVMAVVGENVNTLQSLSYSRDFEREADAEGFKIVTSNAINPKGMVTLFERLQQGQNIEIPEFISSHPITQDRIKNIEKRIKKASFQYNENLILKSLFLELKK